MRFRTRLFLIWGGVVLLLYAGTWFPVLRSVESSFDRMASHSFSGTRRDLQSLQAERVRGMRQAAAMVMNIPELRALIAEHNFEISAENLASLQERLDNLAGVVGVSFICVLDARGGVIAQNHASPWTTLADLQTFLAKSPEGRGMVNQVFRESASSSVTASTDIFGMWDYQKRIYQVVGVPLVFNSDTQAKPEIDGAFIMAAPLTDDLAASLAQSQGCQVSFLSDGGVAASNLSAAGKTELQAQYRTSNWPLNNTFDVRIGGVSYRSSMDPLIDPCSGLSIGSLLIQSDLKESTTARQKVSKRLLASMIGGLFAAAVASFLVSGAVTKPVRDLSLGVKRLAESDLDVSVEVRGKGELGALATAFNDMVRQLRARRELERLVEESRAMSRAKSQFLANMSHEIRTPLNGVIGMAELLLRTTLNDRQRRYAAMVKSSAEVLTTLINDILDFSKMEAGKLELEAVDFYLHDLVEDVVELLGIKAQAKGLQVAADIAPQTPMTVRGDPTRLRQVLVNLMNNAVKFTDRGEVVVRVTGVDEGGPGRLRFEVIDSGIGIPAERMDRLFRSFSQVDASTTRRFGGTGLGLAICKQLVELMGGGIGVTSEAGRGSTFWFTVALEARPQEQSTDENEVVARFSGLRALIVDANERCPRILARTLATLGVNAQIVSGAAEAGAAIEHARSQGTPFGAVIVDRRMGSGGADETAPIIRLCRGGSELILSLVPLGAESESSSNHCITKPVRRRQLLQTLATALWGNDAEATAPPQGRRSDEPATATPAASTFRLIVAEDNPVNQIITADLVANAGHACDVVSDGRAAVAAFERGGYDLILMDCQMPEMDGFEATRAIRALERAGCSDGRTPPHIPIIALTAHAGAEDRARCMEAGMDDYCSKPFVVDRFLATIGSLLPARSAVVQAATEARPVQSDAVPTTARVDSTLPAAIAPPPFDLESLLGRCTGNGELALAVLGKFETQAAQVMVDLQRNMENGEFEDAARTAHRLKGTAGVLSASAMRDAAVRVEQLSQSRDADAFADGLSQFRHEIARCVAYIDTARTMLRKSKEVV